MTGWFYRCRHCATWALTAHDAGPFVRCNGCGGAKRFMHCDEPDDRALAYARQHGVAHLPIPDKTGPKPCVRCGEPLKNGIYRPDGFVCKPCYHAEVPPDIPTPEQMAENVRRAEEKRQRDQQWEREHNELQFAQEPKS